MRDVDMTRRTGRTIIVLAVALTICAGTGGSRAQDSATAPSQAVAPFSPALDPSSVRRVTDAVAAWQMSHLDDFSYLPTAEQSDQERGWVQAALWIGAWRWSQETQSDALERRVLDWAQTNEFRLGDRLYHADDHAVAQVYLEMHRKGLADDEALVGTRAYFDAILAAPSTVPLAFQTTEPLPCLDRWCWSDALFMAPPAWFQLSRETGDPRYRAFADREFWSTADYLFDPEAGLFFRDSRFFERRGEHGEKLFWSRGNGWVIAGLIALLEVMPADDPGRGRYETVLKSMARSLKAAQQPSGFWSPSLLAVDGPPESSGTAFFVFGLQRGIDLGLLPAADYAPTVERGWRALVGAVQPDGRLAYTQQIGAAPDTVRFEDTQLYGAGAFMLAGSAIHAAGQPR